MFELFADQSELADVQSSPDPRCDNYDDYLDDELGYAWKARDIIGLETLERHDAWRAASAEELAETDDAAGDFVLWGRARRWRELGDIERFEALVREIVGSDDDSPGLDYREIHLFGARVLADDGRREAALNLLDRHDERWPETTAPSAQLRVVVLLDDGQPDEADRVLDQLAADYEDDAEVVYEIAETLVRADARERAGEWLERARETAERTDNRPVRVDIALLDDRISGSE